MNKHGSGVLRGYRRSSAMHARAGSRAVIRIFGRGAVMPAAALLVHQLRFMLAFGSGTGVELARQGHSYLHSLVPWIVVLVAVAAGGFLSRVGRTLGGQLSLPRYTLSFAALWLVCSICLIGIYIGQELLEGAFVAGHPAWVAGVFGYGGWWAIPAALCVGLVLAAIFHGARWALAAAERFAAPVGNARARASAQPRPRSVTLPRFTPLSLGWSGRGPPV